MDVQGEEHEELILMSEKEPTLLNRVLGEKRGEKRGIDEDARPIERRRLRRLIEEDNEKVVRDESNMEPPPLTSDSDDFLSKEYTSLPTVKHKQREPVSDTDAADMELGVDSEEEAELLTLKEAVVVMKVQPYKLQEYRSTSDAAPFYVLYAVEYIEKKRGRKDKSFADGEAKEDDDKEDDELLDEKEHTLEELYGDNEVSKKKKTTSADEKREKKRRKQEKLMVKITGDLVKYIASPTVYYELQLRSVDPSKRGNLIKIDFF